MTKKQLNVLLQNVKDDEEIIFYVMDAEYEHNDGSGEGLFDMGIAKIIELEKSVFNGSFYLTLHVNKA